MDDPIFAAAAYLDNVWRQASYLTEDIIERLNKVGIVARLHDERGQGDDEYSERRWVYHLRVTQPRARRGKDAEIVLSFDLARPEGVGDWAFGRKALLVIAYSDKIDDG